MKITTLHNLKCVLLVLIALTLAFIFVHSALPRSVSSSESGGVAGFLEKIFPADTPFGAFVQRNVRKIAHFFEHGLLGLEVALYAILCVREKKCVLRTQMKWFLISLSPSLFVGVIDETIQIFSGRGPAIIDVWIDVFGYAVFSVLTFAVYTMAVLLRRYFAAKKNTVQEQ